MLYINIVGRNSFWVVSISQALPKIPSSANWKYWQLQKWAAEHEVSTPPSLLPFLYQFVFRGSQNIIEKITLIVHLLHCPPARRTQTAQKSCTGLARPPATRSFCSEGTPWASLGWWWCHWACWEVRHKPLQEENGKVSS